ncbi:hypothetical protein [Roseivirga sp. 4D4]|uniref:hypothetical protein n=1 Tax=Roseivirga sp. 4D4 TaxID=1889784 RepID=UPI001112E6BC|nr:hypothetical protein [Roseivirga sp. 4D4]
MKFFKPFFIFSSLLILIVSCGKDEDQEAPDPFTFSETQLLQMHNGDQKVWHITEFYEDYEEGIKSDLEACLLDETYTFLSTEREVLVEHGQTSCYWTDPEVQFGGAVYTYYPESGDLFLDFSIAEGKGTSTSATLWILRLIELTPNRMVFANGVPENRQRAVVFEVN